MKHSRATKSEFVQTINLAPGSNQPRQKQKGYSDEFTAVQANQSTAVKSTALFTENTATNGVEKTANKTAFLSGSHVGDEIHPTTVRPLQATAGQAQLADESPLALWPNWPAARIDRQGVIHTNNAKVLQTLKPIMLNRAAQPAQLTASANRRLWSLVDAGQTQEQWKVLDPVFWPFLGIIGWSPQTSDALQLAAWETTQTPWEIDDSWRQILTATAAVKAKRKRRVA